MVIVAIAISIFTLQQMPAADVRVQSVSSLCKLRLQRIRSMLHSLQISLVEPRARELLRSPYGVYFRVKLMSRFRELGL